MIGSGTYNEARRTGLEEYEKVSDDPAYWEVSVNEVRDRTVAPTPYMDEMPDGGEFYQRIEEISSEITSARGALKRAKDIMEEGPVTPKAEELQ